MTNNGFTEQQREELQALLNEQRSNVMSDTRQIVREELKPIRTQLSEIQKGAREDADALNSTVVHHGERLNRVDKHLDLEPLPQP